MFLRILKNDLKRKKTMNCIILLFVIMSSMFAASSVNNAISVIGGLDYYFDKAGMADYFIVASGDIESLDKVLDESEHCKGYNKEDQLKIMTSDIYYEGEKAWDTDTISFLTPIDNRYLKFFDKDNNEITEVEKGKVYFPAASAQSAGIEIGDEIEIRIENKTMKLEYAGLLKDALFGSPIIANPRFLMNNEDYRELADACDLECSVYYVNTDDTDALSGDMANSASLIWFSGDRDTIKLSYMVSMMVAAMMLAVSICLILVAFTMLRFTIGFTINEEFREIGVMKALGLKNTSIRSLYTVKYLGISLTGAVIGYFCSIPFGKMLLMSVSDMMVLDNDNDGFIGILCAAAVVLLIMGFCWGCTGKIKKLSPIDAVRSGQTGERFRKKSVISLSKSKMSAGSFLPLNDVLSAPKTYGMVTLILSLCMILVMMLATTTNTLRSGRIIDLFGCLPTDLYFSESDNKPSAAQDDTFSIDTEIERYEKLLAENDMPGKVSIEANYNIPVESDDTIIKVMMLQNKMSSCDEYKYTEGTPPQNAHEVAFTDQICKQLGADIGDKVKLTLGGKTEDYVITAKFVSMNQVGKVGRLHPDAPTSDSDMAHTMAYQVNFDDAPDKDTLLKYQQKLKDLLDSNAVFTIGEYVDDCAKTADTLGIVKNLVLAICAVIIILISVLLERSFISKEKSEIALMKAMGFKNRSVTAHHSARFMICGIAAALLACALFMPMTKLIMDPIFGMMGAVGGVDYTIDPPEIFGIYPPLLTLLTIIGASITSLYTKTVKASDTADIE